MCTAHPGRASAPLCSWRSTVSPAPAQVGDSLEEFLVSATNDAKLRQLMMSMSEAIRTIAFKVSCRPVSDVTPTHARKERRCCCMPKGLDHDGSARCAHAVSRASQHAYACAT